MKGAALMNIGKGGTFEVDLSGGLKKRAND